ncbi:MAG: pyruvate synthase subunit PorD [Dissulfuribacterales bacterium]
MGKTKVDLAWQELEIGCVVINPGNAAEYKTGDWRSNRPVWDKNRCVKCGICYIFCPDAAIYETEEGYFEADLYYCKGCGICMHECPTRAIKMVEEEE